METSNVSQNLRASIPLIGRAEKRHKKREHCFYTVLPVRFAANPATFGAPCSSVTTLSNGLLTYNPSYALPATNILLVSCIILMLLSFSLPDPPIVQIRLSFSILEVSFTLPECSLLHHEAFRATPSWCHPLLRKVTSS
jgi:hypothetical protein